MKSVVKRLVIGTRWEAPLKRAHSGLTGNRNSRYDWQTIEVMRRALRADSNGIDVGAFEGGMLQHLLRIAPRGQHVAFEPIRERAGAISMRFPGATVHPVALGETPGEATFHQVVEHPALSGLQRRSDLAAEETVREVRVPVETMDRLVPADRPVAFVKIDVEGGELGVFRGGVETMRRTKPVVIFECGLGAADAYGVEPEQVFDFVSDAIGLKISLLDAWLAGSRTLSREEFADQYRESRNFYFVAHP